MAEERLGIYEPSPATDVGYPGHCPNCGDGTVLICRGVQIIWPERTAGSQAFFNKGTIAQHEWVCTFCDESSIVWKIFGPGEDPLRKYEELRLMAPVRAPRELPAEAPPAVRSLYREASIAEFAGALRGAAALYRASVEELVKSQGITKGNLEDKIDGLRSKGVDADIVTDLHEARLTGNWSLHDGLAFDRSEIEDVALLIRDAVHELYVLPKHKEAMRAARAARREKHREEQAEAKTQTPHSTT